MPVVFINHNHNAFMQWNKRKNDNYDVSNAINKINCLPIVYLANMIQLLVNFIHDKKNISTSIEPIFIFMKEILI